VVFGALITRVAAATETEAERRDRKYAEYLAIPQATKDYWTGLYGASICASIALPAPSPINHALLEEIPTSLDLSSTMTVNSVLGETVPSKVWHTACHIAPVVTSGSATTYADHISVDLDLLVTLKNTNALPGCASVACGAETLSMYFSFEDFSTTAASSNTATTSQTPPSDV